MPRPPARLLPTTSKKARILARPSERTLPGRLRGTISVSAAPSGFGFIEPEDGSGQLLVRRGNIDSNRELRLGETVQYVRSVGTFALEAVNVRSARRRPEKRP